MNAYPSESLNQPAKGGYSAQPPMQVNPGGSVKHTHSHHVTTVPQSGFIHDFFSCFDDTEACCLGCWCPCVLFGQTRARLRNPQLQRSQLPCCSGGCWGYAALMGCCPCVAVFFSCMQRGDIRSKYHIEGDACTDCLAHWCCECCVFPRC
jgi:Cys-rich protein (TIGR01571 family)